MHVRELRGVFHAANHLTYSMGETRIHTCNDI